ncbi:MAG: hypothetical protein ACKVU0_05940 [Saprospiraceae bacterium]
MKFTLISLTILTAAFLWLACKHPKYTSDKLPEKQIRWGNGGGFAGKESSHILCDNGQIFSRDILGKTSEAGKTKGKKAKEIFETIESQRLAKMEFHHPGNIYYFLEFQDGDMVSRVVWGDKNFSVGKAVEDLFRELNDLLKKE